MVLATTVAIASGGRSSVVEVTIHFGRANARVESAHIGRVHWVNLWAIQNSPTNGVRVFCVDRDSAEGLAAAFVRCGAVRVRRLVDAKEDC